MPEYRVQRFKEKCLDAGSSLREAGSGPHPVMQGIRVLAR
jgi:hypothetical protein